MKGKTDQVVKLAGDQPKNWLECPIEKRRPRLIGVANESKIRHDRRATIPKRMAEGGKQGGRAPASLNTSGVPGRVRAGVRAITYQHRNWEQSARVEILCTELAKVAEWYVGYPQRQTRCPRGQGH